MYYMKTLFRLHLQNNMLSGTLNGDVIKGMTKLEVLDLSFNMMSGTIPSTLGHKQSNLIRLTLSHNKLSGTLPIEWADIHESGNVIIDNEPVRRSNNNPWLSKLKWY